jgi:hypothetical protein
MKTLTKAVLVLFISASSFASFAQKVDASKKSVFNNFPGAVDISTAMLKNSFVTKSGQAIAIPFNEKFVFKGKVLSNEIKYSNLQSMIIKSENAGNVVFQLSKITNKDNSISYVGRIINTEALEVYEIKNDMANNYRLQKIDLDKILQDCSY